MLIQTDLCNTVSISSPGRLSATYEQETTTSDGLSNLSSREPDKWKWGD